MGDTKVYRGERIYKNLQILCAAIQIMNHLLQSFFRIFHYSFSLEDIMFEARTY
jgi:hypothetical protein